MAIIAQRTQGQGDYTGKVETYDVDAAHARIIAPGDVVELTGTSNATGKAGADNSADGVVATQALGVVASIRPLFETETLNTTTLPATTGGEILVHIDPNVVFLADSDATLVADDVGLNIAYNALESSDSLGTSNYTLDAASALATVTLPFRIVALAEDSDGVLGNRALVTLNDSTLAAGTVGV